MTLALRTVIGGYIVALTAFVLPFVSLVASSVAASFMVPVVAAGLVAYFLVFGSVKNSTHRLLASAFVAPIFLVAAMALNEFIGIHLYLLLPPLAGVVASLSLIAVSFVVAVALVVWSASWRKVDLASA